MLRGRDAHRESVRAGALRDGNVEPVGLANNVVLGGPAKAKTIDILDGMDVAHTGAGMDLQETRKPAMVERNRVRYGSIQRPSTLWPCRPRAVPSGGNLIRDISDLRRFARVTVELCHEQGWPGTRREAIASIGAPGVATGGTRPPEGDFAHIRRRPPGCPTGHRNHPIAS
jgi:hypothetical protein